MNKLALSCLGLLACAAPVAAPDAGSSSRALAAPGSADLEIHLTDNGPVATRTTLTFTATVVNHGPDPATNLTVHVTLPAPASSVRASTDWTCSTAGTLVTCRAAVVTAAPIDMDVLAPSSPGTATATATVGSDTTDPVTGNNATTDDAPIESALTVRGGGLGCSAGGGSTGFTGLLVLLALAAIVTRRRRLAILLALAAPAVASAQRPDFPVERMRAALDRDGIIDVEWAAAVPRFAWNIGTWLGYAADPLVVEQRASGDRVQALVQRRLGGGLFGAVGLLSWLEVGVELPIVYTQGSDGVTPAISSSPKLGDIRFAPKVTLRDGTDRVAIAVMLGFTLQSNTSGAFAGDGGATFRPEVIVSRAWDAYRVSGNVGYLARRSEQLLDLHVDDELTARLGAGYRLPHSPLELDAALNLATAAAKPLAQINTDTAELDVGAQYDAGTDITLFGLAGVGIGSGVGTPDWRALVGIRYSFHAAPPLPAPLPVVEVPRDSDGDGIPDASDRCPNDPEDKDGFEDSDGCPDPDNDKDGVLDGEDRCPLEPGPAGNGGCPDPDRDGDGVPDRLDNCPDEPGSQEHQGCPKPQRVAITDGKLVLLDRVYFRSGQDLIEIRSNPLLDDVARVLVAHPEIAKVRVEGYTDNRGDAKANLVLSQRRAEAVVKYLVAHKVARGQLEPQGFGQDHPIADNTTDTGRATNRRVEFVIVK